MESYTDTCYDQLKLLSELTNSESEEVKALQEELNILKKENLVLKRQCINLETESQSETHKSYLIQQEITKM